jgi:hypothetical protein
VTANSGWRKKRAARAALVMAAKPADGPAAAAGSLHMQFPRALIQINAMMGIVVTSTEGNEAFPHNI